MGTTNDEAADAASFQAPQLIDHPPLREEVYRWKVKRGKVKTLFLRRTFSIRVRLECLRLLVTRLLWVGQLLAGTGGREHTGVVRRGIQHLGIRIHSYALQHWKNRWCWASPLKEEYDVALTVLKNEHALVEQLFFEQLSHCSFKVPHAASPVSRSEVRRQKEEFVNYLHYLDTRLSPLQTLLERETQVRTDIEEVAAMHRKYRSSGIHRYRGTPLKVVRGTSLHDLVMTRTGELFSRSFDHFTAVYKDDFRDAIHYWDNSSSPKDYSVYQEYFNNLLSRLSDVQLKLRAKTPWIKSGKRFWAKELRLLANQGLLCLREVYHEESRRRSELFMKGLVTQSLGSVALILVGTIVLGLLYCVLRYGVYGTLSLPFLFATLQDYLRLGFPFGVLGVLVGLLYLLWRPFSGFLKRIIDVVSSCGGLSRFYFISAGKRVPFSYKVIGLTLIMIGALSFKALYHGKQQSIELVHPTEHLQGVILDRLGDHLLLTSEETQGSVVRAIPLSRLNCIDCSVAEEVKEDLFAAASCSRVSSAPRAKLLIGPFEQGSAIPPQKVHGESLLKVLEGFLTQSELADKQFEVKVIGMASVEGSKEYNEKLALLRAGKIEERIRKILNKREVGISTLSIGERSLSPEGIRNLEEKIDEQGKRSVLLLLCRA